MKLLRRRFHTFTLLAARCAAMAATVLLGMSSAACQEHADAGGETTFEITAHAGFKEYRDVIARFAAKHSPKADSDFCIVGYVDKDESRRAWVLWRQGEKLVLWEDGETDLDLSRRILDLRTDVVATTDELQGSTYRVTRAWVGAVLAGCEKNGTKLRIPAISRDKQD